MFNCPSFTQGVEKEQRSWVRVALKIDREVLIKQDRGLGDVDGMCP